ncbi:hypothetical protein BOTCAL_0218g00090 [Botryotinia calthae]|uniref:Uncharacterized protein n=1 Tax=Botryotinia calthae TaxID=38488 RepID=A0A4Y8CYA0_9HELO|nr:hypothetical protein BOTCAL_0218g00090 [Botryotinia calthae]
MANGWSIVIGLIIVVLACAAAWLLSPKGENQTDYVLSAMASTHRTQKRRLKR